MRYVYLIRDLITKKAYVGQTKNHKARKAGHWWSGRRGGSNTPLYQAMFSLGCENFTFEVIEECADELINEREQHWVAHFDSLNPENGYNRTTGGSYGSRVRPRTEETRQKLSKAFTGRRILEQTKEKLRQANKQRWIDMSAEERQKHAEQTSQRNCGEKNPSYGHRGGYKLTSQQLQKLYFLFMTSTLNNSRLAEQFNVSRYTIRRLRHEYQTHGT